MTMPSPTTSLRSTLRIAVLLLMTVPFAVPLNAQRSTPVPATAPGSVSEAHADAEPPPVSVWRTNLSRQLSSVLRSRIDQVRITGLQTVIVLANQHKGEHDLTGVVPALLKIYEYEHDQRIRLMALSALHAIEDESGMQYVAKLLLKERSPRMRQHARNAVADHYLKQQKKAKIEKEKADLANNR